MSAPKVAIVDAYSSAKQYAAEFKRRGFECVHIQSTEVIPAVYAASFRPKEFSERYSYEKEGLESLLAKLRDQKVKAVIAGTETGVAVADQLSHSLGLISNGIKMSAAKRDKFKMWKALQNAGVPTARFFQTDSLAEALSWVSVEKLMPVVLKPVASAGTDSVFICQSPHEIEEAFVNILGKKNSLGLINEKVLLQEFIIGEEYVVNTVAHKGQHRVTDIIRYRKQKLACGAVIYDRDDFLDGKGDVEKELTAYVLRALKALEIENGPSHTEVWMTKNGPRLMETGARIDGVVDVEFSEALYDTNQVDLTVDAYTDEAAFFEKAKSGYGLKKRALLTYLISSQEGMITSTERLKVIESLPSFYKAFWKVGVGDRIKKTIDLFTCPGYVYLCHGDGDQLEKDYAAIRQLEKGGLFDVA